MQKPCVTNSSKIEFKDFVVRLGKIFSNLSIFALILCFSGILSFVSTVFILVLGFCIILLSLGLIFVAVPNYFDILMSVSNVSAKISGFFLQNFYIFASIAILGSIISLVLLLSDKTTKHTARIVVSSIIIVITLIAIIVFAIGGLSR